MVVDRLLFPGDHGTYVDVGANHPIDGSNTYRLYLRGWSGLAIDPNPSLAEMFEQHRPRDTFLAEGVALEHTTLTYHAFDNSVFNTFDEAVVKKLVAQGRPMRAATPVRCRPLADIILQYLGHRHIDILNVDCEGLDLDVLISLNLDRNRPTCLIVEDYARFLTFQRDGTRSDLDHLLSKHNYAPIAQMAWSCIYVAKDWENLVARSAAFRRDRMPRGYLPLP